MNAQEGLQDYTKTVNADQDGLSTINTLQSDPSFRILNITANTHNDVKEFIQSKTFCEVFNGASHWFVIAVQIEDVRPSKHLLPPLSNRKPVILQWHSSSTKKLYYRNSGNDGVIDFDLQSLPTLSEEQLSETLSNEGQFTFQLLLQALQANLGGQLSDNLLTATLDTAREFNGWRLIDYAARDGDSLSLRWLMLSVTSKDFTKKYDLGQQPLVIAAQHATSECLSALLNLPFSATVTKEWQGRDQLELKDFDGNTPLMIAAQNEKIENFQLLIDLGADLRDAVEGVWKNKQYIAVKRLLEADSPFPQVFQEQNIDKLKESDCTCQVHKAIKDNKIKDLDEFIEKYPLLKPKAHNGECLEALVLQRSAFHEAIKGGKFNYVEEFIKNYPRLKHAYNTRNDSALTHALNNAQYDIYVFLQSQGYTIGSIEEEQYPAGKLSDVEKEKLKEAKERYFAKSKQSHIEYLVSRSKLKSGQTDDQQAFDKIKKWYKTLDGIPEISTILKVVEQVDALEIIFDFDSDTITDMDPTQSKTAAGASDFLRGTIKIGAKTVEEDLLGTLAHELCHLAMQIRYNNECNPYETLDKEKKDSFAKIIKEYQQKFKELEEIEAKNEEIAENNKRKGKNEPLINAEYQMDEIIERTFSAYREKPNEWPSELIVRVPHVLAKYGNDEILQKQALSLLSWYCDNISSDFTRFIRNPKVYKTQNKIEDLNKQFELLDRIKKRSTSIKINDDRLLRDKVIDRESMTILSTSSHELTLLNLYQKLANRFTPSQLVRNILLVQPAHMKNHKTTILDALRKIPDFILVIDNVTTALNEPVQKALLDDLQYIKSQVQKVLLIVPKNTSKEQWEEFSPRPIIPDGVYNWPDLTPKSQEDILKKEVKFQGYTVKLNQLINAALMHDHIRNIIDSDTLYALITEQIVEIGSELPKPRCYDEDYYIDREFNPQVTLNKKKLNEDIENGKIQGFFIISGNEIRLQGNDNQIYVFDNNDHAEAMFKELREKKPNDNIHWLISESDKLIWRKSHGSIVGLIQYKEVYTAKEGLPHKSETEIVDQNSHNKIVLLSATAGMGKSATIASLSLKIKKKYPNLWVIRVDLISCTKALKKEEEEREANNPSFNNREVKPAIKFLQNSLLASQEQTKLTTKLEEKLFEYYSIHGQGEIVLFVDAFDEIIPDYKDIIIELLQGLKQSNIKKLFIATRPAMSALLEEKLDAFACTLEPFLPANQMDFLIEFWKKKLAYSSIEENHQYCFAEHADAVLNKFSHSNPKISVNEGHP